MSTALLATLFTKILRPLADQYSDKLNESTIVKKMVDRHDRSVEKHKTRNRIILIIVWTFLLWFLYGFIKVISPILIAIFHELKKIFA